MEARFKQYSLDLKEMNVGEVLDNEPIYKHTTFKVGGPARIFVKVKDIDSLVNVIKYCRKRKIKLFIIGRGSNLLFSDKAFDGIIISLNDTFNSFSINGNIVEADGGVSMIKLAYETAKVGLSGFEFMGGIPGNIGGGIYMNAGAYKHDLSEVVESVTILDDKLKVRTLTKEEMKFSYRHSIIQDHPKYIVLKATFKMNTKDPKEIQATLDRRKERRMSSQPWNFPSCGSVFRNPKEGNAWKFIDDAGLRGYEIGGAQVSPKHSNFIVNNGYASAKDIYDIIAKVHDTVLEKYGIDLKKEVCFINWE
ncbi:MAG: UDP-N-acetylmuramate dehydrogenase [Thomasclavelia sp.]|jgi:UDP-N-acetylmuramate dehydrogenase|nr:UDP-N-acetylmuramate dehydrogenase [Thomasclavelia sp.]